MPNETTSAEPLLPRSQQTCATCDSWQPASNTLTSRGHCRANPPTISGWPLTSSADWCRAWKSDTRPKAVQFIPATPDPPLPVGIDFCYVRDFPDLATQWITAARQAPDIPADLSAVLADPLAGIVTGDLPLISFSHTPPDADSLFNWADQFLGYDAVGETDASFRSILDHMDPETHAASETARQSLPADHPWRTLFAFCPPCSASSTSTR
jgi:hypothetical protein